MLQPAGRLTWVLLVVALFTALVVRIGEASHPGPAAGNMDTTEDQCAPCGAQREIGLLQAAVKQGRNSLAVSIARAPVEEVAERPIFKDQLEADAPPRRRRRARIQEPLAMRAHAAAGCDPHWLPAPAPVGPTAPAAVPAARSEAVEDQGPPAERRYRGGRRVRGTRAGARVRRGRGTHYSAAAGRRHVDIFFANITLWNEAAEDHLKSIEADVVLLAEVHLKRDRVGKALALAGRHGWEATVGPAQQSVKSEAGSNGGVLAMTHCRWRSDSWPDTVDNKGRVGPYHDIVGRSICVDGICVEVMVAYFEGGEGVLGRNRSILCRAEHRSGVGKSPFILAADFNMPPAEFEDQASEWLARNEAVVLKPSNMEVTCRASVKGSLIDYFVVSRRLAGLVLDIWVDVETPWWPHYGVRLRLAGRPSVVMARQLCKHRAAPPPHQDAGDGDKGPKGAGNSDRHTTLGQRDVTIDRAALWDTAWGHAVGSTVMHVGTVDEEAGTRDGGQDPEEVAIVEYAKSIDMHADSQAIGKQYDTWRHALLVYSHAAHAAHKSGGRVADASEAQHGGDQTGRDIVQKWLAEAPERPPPFPTVRRSPVLRRTFDSNLGALNGHTRGGGGPVESRLLRILRQWLAAIGRWSHDAGFGHNTTARHIIGLCAKVLCGATPTSARFLNELEEDDRYRLTSAAGPPIVMAWNGSAARVEEAVAVVDELLKKAIANGHERRRRGFDAWLADALVGGARAAHRFINKDGRPPPLQLVLVQGEGANRRVIADPDEVAEHHASPWRSRWECEDAEAAAEEVALIRARRAEGRADSVQYAEGLDVSPRAIRAACSSFRKGTAIGGDDVLFSVVLHLPDSALVTLGAIIRVMIARAAVPPCALVNLLSLLGKKGGGSRTIATMSSIYRLALRISGDDVADWDCEKAGHFDTAVAGSSALRAHILRALEVELAKEEDLAAAHFLWDMEKFYDVIRVGKLLPRLEAMGYPAALATLGLVAHRAPRLLGTGIGVSRVIDGMSRSIIAGCQQSVSWTRALLHAMVQRLGFIVPGSICYEHVDDLSQVVTAPSGSELRSALITIGSAVGEEVANLDLKLSGKSVVLPRGDPEVERAAKALNDKGIRIKTAATGEDLGVQCSGGRRRTAGTLRRRIAATAVKAERLHHLARRNRTATKLARPGLCAKQSYGHQAQGAAPSLVALMRRNFRRSSHLGGTSGCTTSTIWWTFGPAADPGVRIPIEQISEWIDLWLAAPPPLRRRIRRCWMRLMPSLVRDPDRWRRARGPMAATICTLVDLGWKPASPAHWRVDDKLMAVADGAAFAKAHILARAQADLVKALALKANDHPHGKGMGDAIYFDGIRKARKNLIKDGDFVAASALELVAVGGILEPSVSDPAAARNEQLCCRCGMRAVATRWHDLYECPDNREVDGDDLAMDTATKELLAEARKEAAVAPCLWFRGIIPATRMQAPHPPEFDEVRYSATPGLARMLAATRVGYSDGSGGQATSHALARKVFCGAATYQWEEDDITAEGLAAEVPGRQTVPRAEIWGAALLVCAAPREGPFEIVLDAAYVARGLGSRGDLLRSPNGDLWSILYHVIDGRNGPVAVSKVKSHVIDEDVQGITLGRHRREHVVGNELADAAAEAGAALFKGEELAANRRIGFVIDQACRVATRIARIQVRIWKARNGAEIYEMPALPAFNEELEDPTKVARDIFAEIARKGHRVSRAEGGLRCSRCGVFRGWKRREYWTTTPCRPKASAEQTVKRLRTAMDVDGAPASPAATTLLGDPHVHFPPAGAPLAGPTPGLDVGTTSGACSSWEPIRVAPAPASEAIMGHLDRASGDQAMECDLTEGGNDFEGKLDGNFGYEDLQGTLNTGAPVNDDFDGDLVIDDLADMDCRVMRTGDRAQAFDDPEGVGLLERIDEEAAAGFTQGETAFEEPPEPPLFTSVAQAPTTQDACDDDLRAHVVRRRLGFKASPTEAAARGYPMAAPGDQKGDLRLVSRTTAAAAKRKVAELVKGHRDRAAAARDAGWAAVRRAPEHAVEETQAGSDYGAMVETVVPKAWQAHDTHQPRRAPGNEIVYCAICGAWSSGQRARGLTLPCKGEAGSRGKYLRLLRLGIKPVPGAKVPEELKAAKARGTRSRGIAVPRASRRGARRVS